MNTTVRIDLDKRRVNKDGLFPIVFKVTHNRVQTTISTGFSVDPKNWNDNFNQVRRSTNDLNKDRVNNYLKTHFAKFIGVIDDLDKEGSLAQMNIKDLRKHLVNDYDNSLFYDFAMNFIDNVHREKIKFNTYKIFVVAINRFVSVTGKNLKILDIDANVIRKVSKSWTARGVATNTKHLYFTKIIFILRYAIYKNVIPATNFPFKRYSYENDKYELDRMEDTKKRSLSTEVIGMIERFESNNVHLMRVKHIFLFSFYTRGTNISNLYLLKKSDVVNGVLQFRRKKTNARISISLHEKAVDILKKIGFDEKGSNDYLFRMNRRPCKNEKELALDITRQTININYHLSRISKILNIPVFTSYAARHSWATIAYKKGIDKNIISAGLAHADVQTTSIYIDSLIKDDTLTAADLIVFDNSSELS